MKFVHVTSDGLGPYLKSLRALEGGIRYPIADGADFFTIDHGPAYHPFFSQLGEAHFLLALQGDEVVGSIAGVLRPIDAGGRSVAALYLCDLKVAATLRGQGLARRMLQRGLLEILKHPRGRKARLLYGAAMRGSAGDVMRSARGSNPLRLAGTLASFQLYFVPAEKLAALSGEGPTFPPGARLCLSGSDAGPVRTTGAKELRLGSSGSPWPLVHLTDAPWNASWASSLRAALKPGELGCFALDVRLLEHHRWLRDHGITPGAGCTVYGLALTRLGSGLAHLATSEI